LTETAALDVKCSREIAGKQKNHLKLLSEWVTQSGHAKILTSVEKLLKIYSPFVS